MAANAARSALTNGQPEVLQKYTFKSTCNSTLGQIVRTRRNPASQTI